MSTVAVMIVIMVRMIVTTTGIIVTNTNNKPGFLTDPGFVVLKYHELYKP